MAYSLSTDVAPRERTPGVPFVRPKTHTPVSRLQQRGQRYYNPELGRWISRDPLREESFRLFHQKEVSEGIHLYSFLENKPCDGVDPIGLSRFISGWAGSSDFTGPVASEILKILNDLDNKTDALGRKCFKTYLKDFLKAYLPTIQREVSLFSENVHFIAHGALEVNGQQWNQWAYIWNRRDKVVEGLDKDHNGQLTPLAQLGSRLDMDNIFACYVGSGNRKIKDYWNPLQTISTSAGIDSVYRGLRDRLLRYKSVTDCPCRQAVIVYEGER